MDIFNRKLVEDLKCDILGLKQENEDLRRELQYANEYIAKLMELENTTPEDCIPGQYCEACNFAKQIHYYSHVHGRKAWTGYDYTAYGYICTRGDVCKNFIQKDIEFAK